MLAMNIAIDVLTNKDIKDIAPTIGRTHNIGIAARGLNVETSAVRYCA